MTLFTNNFIHNHFWPVLAWYQPDPGLCNLALKRVPFWISRAKNYIYIYFFKCENMQFQPILHPFIIFINFLFAKVKEILPLGTFPLNSMENRV